MLGLLSVSAFFIWFENFKHSRTRSIDEIVYYRMAEQLLRDPLDYNTIPYGQELSRAGRPLPEYFFRPLFKHPPLFTYLVALALKLFGNDMNNAAFVPLLFGVLTIPLAYFLGKNIFSTSVGIIAAFIVWADPVSIISSQKIWMDSTISCLMVATILCYVLALKRNQSVFYIAGGVVAGLAVLTKYTGLLPWFILIVYSVLFRRDLFGNKLFRLGLVLPILLLLPWIYWNYLVYGSELASVIINLNDDTKLLSVLLKVLPAVLLVAAGVIFFLSRSRKKNVGQPSRSATSLDNTLLDKYFLIIGGAITLLLVPDIIRSLSFFHLPQTSWQQNFFAYEPAWFYFKQLIIFSLLYLFAFAGLFFRRYGESGKFLQFSAFVILLFFIAWRNYQCRYVMASLPLLAVLAAETIMFLWAKIALIKGDFVRKLVAVLFLIVFIYIISKLNFVNTLISFPNDLCYY